LDERTLQFGEKITEKSLKTELRFFYKDVDYMLALLSYLCFSVGAGRYSKGIQCLNKLLLRIMDCTSGLFLKELYLPLASHSEGSLKDDKKNNSRIENHPWATTETSHEQKTKKQKYEVRFL
jgi:hypothetical protein